MRVFGGFFQNTQLSAGFDNMRSPIDLEDTGNTGGNFAVNWGSVRPVFGGLHVQAGVRGVFTDLNGEIANGFITDDCRSQLFWTAGLYFRANQYSTEGLSMGVVYDSLREKYYRKYELSQLRTEVSYTFCGGTTIGFRGAFGLEDGSSGSPRPLLSKRRRKLPTTTLDSCAGILRKAAKRRSSEAEPNQAAELSEALLKLL